MRLRHSFIHLFIHSPSHCEAQDAPGVVLGIGGIEVQRWVDKVPAPAELTVWWEETK